MSKKALSEYTFYSRYASYSKEKNRRETWHEAVTALFDMHKEHYADAIAKHPKLLEEINFAYEQQLKKRVLAAQRTLQFKGDPIFKHHMKVYNCCSTHIDRNRVFQELMYILLCGCGAGFSVQEHHVDKLSKIEKRNKEEKIFVVEDSIEGWSDAIGVLMASYFTEGKEFQEFRGHKVKFDLTKIRAKGTLIAGRFKAPGPDGLANSLKMIEFVIERRLDSELFNQDPYKNKLRPIDAYDVIMHTSDAVLSGGVRRSATLCMFSHTDEDMLNAKTGSWFHENPQRGRSNNSVTLLKGHVTKEEFARIMKSTKECGEPGFIWVEDLEICYNPCVEIGMIPKTVDGESGIQGCNLTEINGKFCKTEEDLLQACRASAIIGTLQAGYTDFKYVSPATKKIFDKEALLGCSITGMMDNPEILFDEKLQRKGAQQIKKTNKEVAAMIGINQAARTTCVKPAGSTSCVLQTASGIHPQHARRYIRRVQANKTEYCAQHFEEINPLAVEDSVWSNNGTDVSISFLCEVPAGAIIKNQIGALDLLEKVKLTQQNWVEAGTNLDICVNKALRHNVSNTVTVKDDEWEDVEAFIFKNQKWFAGISLLSHSGDKDYQQAPFTTIHTSLELSKMYGSASHFASGLIVDGLHAFDGNLWNACDSALGIGEALDPLLKEPIPLDRPVKGKMKAVEYNKLLANYAKQLEKFIFQTSEYAEWDLKVDWVRRLNQFADKYFEGNKKNATYCLKDVSNLHLWEALQASYKEIDWSEAHEPEYHEEASELSGQACSGGQCELK